MSGCQNVRMLGCHEQRQDSGHSGQISNICNRYSCIWISMLVYMYDRADRDDRTLTATLGAGIKLTARRSRTVARKSVLWYV